MTKLYLYFALLVLLIALAAGKTFAATLMWDAANGGPLTVERGTSPTGPFSTVATLPTGATSYILTPGAYGWYRVRYSGLTNSLPSNSVQFSLDFYTGLVTDRLMALETRVTALEAGPVIVPPSVPASNLTTRQIDADRVEIVGTGCTGLRTTGAGLRRVVECLH